MSYSYIVKFAHDDATQEEMHGWGTAEITTDLPITTEQQKIEVARTIGLKNKFTRVAILEVITKQA